MVETNTRLISNSELSVIQYMNRSNVYYTLYCLYKEVEEEIYTLNAAIREQYSYGGGWQST